MPVTPRDRRSHADPFAPINFDVNVGYSRHAANRMQAAERPDRAMSAAPSPKNDDPRDEATQAATSLPSGGTWSGRFAEPVSARMQRFNASIDFDRRLADVDIAASLAHARMLAHTNIISADDLRAIESGLAQIGTEIERGEFQFTRDLEDIHFNIERRLTTLVGDAGKRLHTARSRNDQVATDLRLWLRGAIDALIAQ